MLTKFLTQCLAPQKYFSNVCCYCFLCPVTEPDVCLFPQLSGIFFWKVLITFRLFKMVSLERMQEVVFQNWVSQRLSVNSRWKHTSLAFICILVTILEFIGEMGGQIQSLLTFWALGSGVCGVWWVAMDNTPTSHYSFKRVLVFKNGNFECA